MTHYIDNQYKETNTIESFIEKTGLTAKYQTLFDKDRCGIKEILVCPRKSSISNNSNLFEHNTDGLLKAQKRLFELFQNYHQNKKDQIPETLPTGLDKIKNFAHKVSLGKIRPINQLIDKFEDELKHHDKALSISFDEFCNLIDFTPFKKEVTFYSPVYKLGDIIYSVSFQNILNEERIVVKENPISHIEIDDWQHDKHNEVDFNLTYQVNNRDYPLSFNFKCIHPNEEIINDKLHSEIFFYNKKDAIRRKNKIIQNLVQSLLQDAQFVKTR